MHPTCTLDQRLQYQSGDLFAALIEQIRECFQSFPCTLSALVFGHRCLDTGDEERPISLLVELHITDTQCTKCFTMVAVGQREKERAILSSIAMVVITHLQCHLYRTRSIISKKDFL